ncbi:MAG: S8 family serine peptidase [Planctomycetes bacterium]|nr:S8 family serine peptidase [Planctomycetota bacterium]
MLVLAAGASAITSSGVEAPEPGGTASWPNVFSDVDINELVGAPALYQLGYMGSRAVIANVEAGYVWGQHDVMRFRDPPVITQIKDTGAAGGYDFHATMVGHVLVGEAPVISVLWAPGVILTYKPAYYEHFFINNEQQTPLDATLWYGLAPQARLGTVALATDWVRDDTVEYGGEFNISAQSAFFGYATAMAGTAIGGAKADVVNSSWGGDDPAGTDSTTRLIDALAYANRTTVCLAAGNESAQVVGPGSGYNSITVGALAYDSAAHPYHAVADFSATGPNDFYNPKTGATVPGVRAAVDLVAPGDNLTLGCYGGLTGGHNPDIGTDPTLDIGGTPSGAYYFITAGGTSFASPIVAGGAALLVDLGKARFGAGDATDGRVIKAVLMNSAAKVDNWDNGQHPVTDPAGLNGVVIATTQSLDYASGAGRMDLARALRQYTLGNPGAAPGQDLAPIGWSYAVIQPDGISDYSLVQFVDAGTLVAATLDWFVDRAVAGTTGEEVQFANLDLEMWKLTGLAGSPEALVATSASLYNNVEHLYLNAPADGYYMLRVKWAGENYGLQSPGPEPYALAWSVPEPGTLCLLLVGAAVAVVRRRRKITGCKQPVARVDAVVSFMCHGLLAKP